MNPAPSEPPVQTRRRVERPSIQETAAFVAFYELYPRKKARPDAMKAWQQMGCEAVAAEVMAGLAAQLPELRSRSLDKVSYPAPWLRDQEWKDPPIQIAAPRAPLPFAIAAEETRQERAWDSRVEAIRERIQPAPKPTFSRAAFQAELLAEQKAGAK